MLPLLAAGAVGLGMSSGGAIGAGLAGGATLGAIGLGTAAASSGGGLSSLLFGGAGGGMGLFGAGGKFGLGQTMMTTGMGLSALQAMGKGASLGSAFQGAIPLSETNKKLMESIFNVSKKEFEEAKKGLLPENLAAPFIKQIKTSEAKRRKAAQGMFSQMVSKGYRTGGAVKGATTEALARMEGEAAPTEWRAKTASEQFLNKLTQLANIRNIDIQSPALSMQSQMYRTGIGQMRDAWRGQVLGNIAKGAGMMYFAGHS